ncbi:MAG TPA: hypothetical protein VLA60_01465 [Nitrospirales bacterium]|nr:hypothetical protein [Nitrospirales bacterium]
MNRTCTIVQDLARFSDPFVQQLRSLQTIERFDSVRRNLVTIIYPHQSLCVCARVEAVGFPVCHTMLM